MDNMAIESDASFFYYHPEEVEAREEEEELVPQLENYVGA